MFQFTGELILKLSTPDTVATCTVTQRVSGLDHELRDDTMEDDALVVATARMTNEVLDRLRRLLWEQA